MNRLPSAGSTGQVRVVPSTQRWIDGTGLPEVAAVAVAPEDEPPPAAPTEEPATRPVALESWSRVALLPGLELWVKADASPVFRRLVEQVHQQCFG